MAKLRMTHGDPGCRVSGCCYRADGRPLAGVTVRFLPAKSGMWGDRVIGRAPVETITDGGGRFTLSLAPSSVMGRYEVVIDEARYVVDVPDQPAAAFEEIALVS